MTLSSRIRYKFREPLLKISNIFFFVFSFGNLSRETTFTRLYSEESFPYFSNVQRSIFLLEKRVRSRRVDSFYSFLQLFLSRPLTQKFKKYMIAGRWIDICEILLWIFEASKKWELRLSIESNREFLPQIDCTANRVFKSFMVFNVI